MKEDFLKDTVNNLISEINTERKAKTKYTAKLVTNTSALVNLKMPTEKTKFKHFIIDFFYNNTEYDFWTILVWDNKQNKAISDSHNLAGTNWNATLNNIKTTLSSYQIINQGDETAVFGISKSYVDDLVKEDIADTIRNFKFGDDSYIWVTEILNYKGGKNFAIRRVHPNLPETEGSYLSSDMVDIKGNHLYTTELEGINKDGELFFTYYFKELRSDTVSEKLTFAKLYKDFNWVIAMGVYQKDLQSYIDKTNKESETLVSRLSLILVFIFVIILIFSFVLVIIFEKLNFRHSQKLLESEVNQDMLTKSGSRRSGTKELIRAFKEYKKNGSNPGIMIFDIDYFKNINDTYGHASGDLVLTEIVKALYEVIRSSDRIIRWGGDEFVVIFYGLPQNKALDFGKKVSSVISSLNISVENHKINPTLSIGFSYFKETDSDYMNVLDRADQALYQSKINGRNQVNLIL